MQFYKKSKLIFIILFFNFFTLNAQKDQYFGSIKGQILAYESHQPLSDVEIKLCNTKEIVKTDEYGFYEFKKVSIGINCIEINKLGYETTVIQYINVLKNKITYKEIELIKSTDVEKIDSIEIKKVRYESNRSYPISTFVFSREEISLNPGAQGDIFRAIGMLPGVSSSGGIYSAIAVRGQGVRDNVYMVDDIPLTEVGHLEGNSFFNDPNGGRFSIFAPRVIDNALFQGGGFSSEYGRRSASLLSLGIKEGNTFNPIIDGQIDLLGVTLNYDGPLLKSKKTSLFLSARYQNFYALVNLIGLKDIGLPIYGDLIFKTSTQINQSNKLNSIIIVSPESFVRDIKNVYADKKLNLLYLPNFKRNKIILGLNLRTLINQNTNWKNILYFTNYSSTVKVGKAYPYLDSIGQLVQENIPYLPNIQSQNYSENKLGYRSILNVNINKKQKITVGFEFDYTNLKNDRKLIYNDTNFIYRNSDLIGGNQKFQIITREQVDAHFDQTKFNTSAFCNYSTQIGKILHLNAGLRYDYTQFSEQFAFSPRLNGSFFINEKTSVNFGLGTYYQDPVYSDIADLPANSKLKMEKVVQYILTFKKYIKPDLKFTTEMWYKDFNDLVINTINGTVIKSNLGNGWGYGVDLNLSKRLTQKFHGQIGYSFIEIKRNDGMGDYNFSFSQPNQFNLMISYKASKSFTFSTKYRYATGKPADNYIIHSNVLNNTNTLRYSKELIGQNETRLPDFQSFDIRMNYNFTYRKTSFTMFIDIVNVQNKQIPNFENFNPISGQIFYDGLAIFPTGGLKFEF